jgi:hypothetical protein
LYSIIGLKYAQSMTDAPLVPNTAMPPADPTAPAADQNPLDALEAILQQAKAKTDATAPDLNAAPEPDPVALAAAEDARKQAELEQMEAQNKAQDAIKLKAELELLKNVGSSSADQARVAQNEARQIDQEEKADKKAEYLIHQLGHTKI